MSTSKFDTVNGKRVKCYDNGGRTIDRYTVIFLDFPQNYISGNTFPALAMNDRPFHPQGFGQHTDAQAGAHLGKRIPFVSLPPDCRKVVEHDCSE